MRLLKGKHHRNERLWIAYLKCGHIESSDYDVLNTMSAIGQMRKV